LGWVEVPAARRRALPMPALPSKTAMGNAVVRLTKEFTTLSQVLPPSLKPSPATGHLGILQLTGMYTPKLIN
jgi:hypothetical protein